MNFETVCSNCGAVTSPVVGICPFCKSVMAKSVESNEMDSDVQVQALYDNGEIEKALSLAAAVEKQKPDFSKDLNFVMLYVKILFEVDAPSSRARVLLNQALVNNPSNPEILEYLELIEAESHMSRDSGADVGVALMNIVRRSPKNVHALFLLGSYLFWDKEDPQQALRYLEGCVRIRPNFIRAKACLAAVYKTLNMNDVTARLMTECASKTSNSSMKEFYTNFASS